MNEDELIHVTTNVDLILTKTEMKAPHDSPRNLLCWQWLVMEPTGDTISLLRGRWISRAARVCLSWYVDILWLYHKTHAAILEVPLINELQDKEVVLQDTHNHPKLPHRQTVQYPLVDVWLRRRSCYPYGTPWASIKSKRYYVPRRRGCVCITIIIIFSNLTPDNAAITNIIISVCKADKGWKRRERVGVDWNLIYSIDWHYRPG